MEAAYEGFQEVIERSKESEDSNKDEWAFKAKKQMIKTLFEQGTSKRDQVLKQYQGLLDYLENGKVATSYTEKSFTNMLDHLTQGTGITKVTVKDAKTQETVKFVENIYMATLSVLVKAKNERMWIKTNLKLAKFFTDCKDIDKALGVLTQIQDVCLGKDISASLLTPVSVKSEEPTTTSSAVSALATSSDDNSLKSSYLIEVYAQMINLYSEAENYKKVKEIYRLTEGLTSAVTHPRILGVIREAGGKMHMREKRYELARQAFFDSFKNYDEAGSLSRISVLKYYVLACMLSETKINPFESQETRPYINDPQINVMVQLVTAFQKNDTGAFQELLSDKNTADEIQKDQFIKEFIKDIELSARALGILKLVKPYTRVKFSKLAQMLNISEELVQDILTFLILDTKLPRARLDSQGGFVELHAAAVHLDPKSTLPGQSADDSVIASQGNAIMVDDAGVESAKFSSSRGLGIPGGMAPVLRTHQIPSTTWKLVGEDGNLETNVFKALNLQASFAPVIPPDMIEGINASLAQKVDKSKGDEKTKSSVFQLNARPTSADSHALFGMPKRYKQAMEESDTVAGSHRVTTEGGAAAGAGGSSSEAGPSAAGGAGTDAGSGGTGSSSGNAKSLDTSFRGGSIDPENPYAWASQEKMRSIALLSWAKSVDALQQTTQRGHVASKWLTDAVNAEEPTGPDSALLSSSVTILPGTIGSVTDASLSSKIKSATLVWNAKNRVSV